MFSRHHPRLSQPPSCALFLSWPARCKFFTRPLSPLHTRASGMELHSTSSFCLLHRLSFIVLRHDSLLSSSDFYIFDPPWTTHCPARSVSSPALRAGLNFHLTSVSALQLHSRQGVASSSLRTVTTSSTASHRPFASPLQLRPDHVRRALFLHPSPVQLAVFYGSG